jgi:hypothetical protein
MKKKLLYSLCIGAVVVSGFSSCNNDKYLDVTHYSMLEGDQMFVSDDHAIKGMTGCYDQLLPDVNDDIYKY